MTALLLVQLKPILLFLLVGSIVALARLGGGKAGATRRLSGALRAATVRP
jgi:hypothetical protein